MKVWSIYRTKVVAVLNKKGMTLVEVLVALLVTGIILSAVYFVLVRVTLMNKQQQEYVNVQNGLRNTMLVIEKDIRKSSQSIKLTTNASGCYIVRDIIDSQDFEYCVVDGVFLRNGQVLIDSVDQVNMELRDFYNGKKRRISLKVTLTGNYGGEALKHEKKLYLRTSEG